MADATGIHQYSGSAVQSALSAGITNASLTFSITPTTDWPDGSIGNFVATADPNTSLEEKMLCSGLAGGVLTVVTRGYDGTSAVAHASGAVIIHTVSAIDLAEANWIANFHARTSKGTPVDADELPLTDSAASFGLKKLTWANIKATLLTYFNTKFSRASFRTQATANSTLTLTVADNEIQEFTGTTAGQIVQEADVTTLFIGYKRRISNKSTQTIAVNSSGGNLITTIPAATDWLFTCNAITGTTAASWSNSYAGASAVPSSGVTFSGAKASISANVSIATGTETLVAFDVNRDNTDAIHSTTVNNTRFTVPTGKAGRWAVLIDACWAGNTTGVRQITIKKNGTGIDFNDSGGWTGAYNNIAYVTTLNLAAGDYIEISVYQTSGGALLLAGDGGVNPAVTQLNFYYIGA